MKRKLFAKPFSQFIKSKSWKNRTILKNLRQCLFKGCLLVYLKWVWADGADAADAGALPDASHPGVQLLGGEHQLDLRGSCRLLKETFVENLNIYVVSTKIQNHNYTFNQTQTNPQPIRQNSIKFSENPILLLPLTVFRLHSGFAPYSVVLLFKNLENKWKPTCFVFRQV